MFDCNFHKCSFNEIAQPHLHNTASAKSKHIDGNYVLLFLNEFQTADEDEMEVFKWALSQKNGVTAPMNYYRAMFRCVLYPGVITLLPSE